MASCMTVRYSTSIFLAAAAIVTLASVATASVPQGEQHAASAATLVQVADNSMQVIEVKHKRLSAEEKAQLN